MSAVRRLRSAVLSAVALACLLTFVSVPAPFPPSPALAPAADLSGFQAGNIVTDAVFYDSASMTAAEIQRFLNGRGADCRTATDGTKCLKDYRQTTTTRAADSFCARYAGAADESAAVIIAKVARACRINPRVLLVTLQKEQGLVTRTTPYASKYRIAMGYGCPDGAPCDSLYYGFFNQLYSAAKQFQRYTANPTNYKYRPGLRTIPYQVAGPTAAYFNYQNRDCGTSSVNILNQATANLYNYTPYQPNAAALAAGYGEGNRCSAYGNRNFWNYFTDWFGSTYNPGRDVDAPMGRLDSVRTGVGSFAIRGWTFDPNALTSPVKVQVQVDGALATTLTADASRPDVETAYSNWKIGPNHGFAASVPAPPGDHEVCVAALNVGAGYTDPELGCASVRVTHPDDPVGRLDEVTVSGATVTAAGWAYDPDRPTARSAVRVQVDGATVAEVPANMWRPDVGERYPEAGSGHGYSWSGTLAAGTHQICAIGVNEGTGLYDTRLGCRSATVSSDAVAALSRPSGALDVLAVSGTAVTAWGWALDRDVPTTPLTVQVHVDGRKVADVVAKTWRTDIGAAFPGIGDRHGYVWWGNLTAGTHTVCVTALNQGAGAVDPQLGCRTVTVGGTQATATPAKPTGRLDTVTVTGTSVTAWGWALDGDVPPAPVPVHVYVDGKFRGEVPASGPRPDIDRKFPAAGPRHGYLWWGTLTAGTHSVCAYGINQGPGAGNTRLGCKSVTVGAAAPASASAPVGSLDAVSATGRTVTASGWTFDPDVPWPATDVHIYVDGTFVSAVPAGESRPDVAAKYPAAGGNHGYTWTAEVPPGAHTVCAYGIDLGPGSNRRLGCRPVTVAK